jgi:hypothetical protein
MKLAQCRKDDSTCTRSLDLGNQILALVREGKTKDEIVKTALTTQKKYTQFSIPAGDAPVAGPADAKVTVLHYLDYQ